jgi:hypothetical protein
MILKVLLTIIISASINLVASASDLGFCEDFSNPDQATGLAELQKIAKCQVTRIRVKEHDSNRFERIKSSWPVEGEWICISKQRRANYSRDRWSFAITKERQRSEASQRNYTYIFQVHLPVDPENDSLNENENGIIAQACESSFEDFHADYDAQSKTVVVRYTINKFKLRYTTADENGNPRYGEVGLPFEKNLLWLEADCQ